MEMAAMTTGPTLLHMLCTMYLPSMVFPSVIKNDKSNKLLHDFRQIEKAALKMWLLQCDILP